jgi:hypothetical protein
MYVYAQRPFAKPATHKHVYAFADTDTFLLEDSKHSAPFWHGLLLHSSTSTLHSAPLQPGLHVHVNVFMAMEEFVLESLHTPK